METTQHHNRTSMKTPLHCWTLLAGCCVAAALLSAQTQTGAQENAVPLAAPQAAPANSASPPYGLVIQDGLLHFKGKQMPATLANAVDCLRNLYPEVNIAMAPSLVAVMITDLKLRSAKLEDALEALRVASGSAFFWLKPGAGGVDPDTGQALPPIDSSLYVLGVDRSNAPTEPRRLVDVFNLTGYFQQLGKGKEDEFAGTLMEIEKIVLDTLTALKQGRLTDEEHPTFRYHKGTGLLVVVGIPEAIDVARKVVTALPGVSRVDNSTKVASPAAGTSSEPNAKAMEAFRRRYGLPPGNPAPSPTPPATNPSR